MAEGERTWPWWIGFGATAVIALFLTWRAYHEDLPEVFRAYDKAVHCTMAGSFAFFLQRATRRRSLWPSAALLVLFGLEEAAQSLSVHRTSSIFDWAADAAGVVVFTALARLGMPGANASKAGSAKPADDVAK